MSCESVIADVANHSITGWIVAGVLVMLALMKLRGGGGGRSRDC